MCGKYVIHSHINLCSDCRNELDMLKIIKNTGGNTVPQVLPAFENISIFAYRGIVRKLIHKLKYEANELLAPTLANLLYLNIKDVQMGFMDPVPDVIVAVPGTPERAQKNLYYPTYLIASNLSLLMNIPFYPGVLYKKRNSIPQSLLGAKVRIKNIKGKILLKLSLAPHLQNKCVLLLDDVTTTGSTLAEAGKTLQQHNVRKLIALTFARREIDKN